MLSVRKNVYIKITPTLIELSSPSSDDGVSLSEVLDHEVWDKAWSSQLHPFDKVLSALVTKAGAEDARAIVIYESPSVAVEVQSNSASHKGALLAAKLAIHDGSSFDADSDPSAFTVLARDDSGEPKRTHVLCAVDTADSARMMVSFIERNGLQVESLTPALALTLSESVRTALDVRTPEPTAVLWLDVHHAAFAVASAGSVHYVRSIDLGIERLMDAMTRPIVRKGVSDGSGVSLTIDEAHDIFHSMGVPEYNQVVDEERGIRGSDLLPLIQPVLQRLVVEIKQSIRFGVPESKRENIRLFLTGPGASIPGFAGVIAEEATLDLYESSNDKKKKDAGKKSRRDTDAAETLTKQINLLPPTAVALRISHRLRKGMIAGVAAGLMLLAADAGWTVWATRALDVRIHALDPIAQRVQQRQNEFDQAKEELTQARQTITNIAEQMIVHANWSAWLAELARLTPPEIRLTRLSGSYDQDDPGAEVAGVVNVASAERTRDLITHYLDSLRACPLVDSVELGGVARNGVNSEATHGFRIAIRLVAVPATYEIEEGGS